MYEFFRNVIFLDHLFYLYRRKFFWKGKGSRLAPCNQSPRSEAYQPPPVPASASPSCNAINHHDKFNYPAVCDKARRASSLLSNFTYLASPLSFRPPLPLHPLSSVFFAENPRERKRENCCSPRIARPSLFVNWKSSLFVSFLRYKR